MDFKTILLDRFLRYVKEHTTSDFNSDTHPSTERQLSFAKKLAQELQDLGLSEVQVNEKAYVTATLPANITKVVPVLGFVAHIDTSPDASAENVKPQVWENYSAEDLLLNKDKNIFLKVKDFPDLKQYKDQTLITTDGTTLLGADDKAGVAIIVTALEYLLKNPKISHGKVKVCFTPDEEIGRGADDFEVEKFGANWAYTLDGGALGTLEYENFNAATAKITFLGKNIHPGHAKDKMVNAIKYAMRFTEELPEDETPENTEGYFGFFHLTDFNGTVSRAELHYLIREFDEEHFAERKNLLLELVKTYQKILGKANVILEIKDQYYNMEKKIAPFSHILTLPQTAMNNLGVTPKIQPIRGGTDGARLSYMGLPCPNLFTGMENIHSVFEYVSLEVMEKSMQTVVEMIKLNGGGE